MKKNLYRHWPFYILLSLLTIFHLWNIKLIPFHPDESTYIYMSQDFKLLFTQPSSLAWKPDQAPTREQQLRELDAPLTRYLIGLGRTLANQPALPSDWSWEKTWSENQQAGALPSSSLLITARISITFLSLFSLIFIYLTGTQLKNRYLGLLSVVFLGINALVLLHARRAMMEGVLLFGVTFFAWSLLEGQKRPWLTGLAMAIAFNAKQSALALFPIGLLAVVWIPQNPKHGLRKISLNVAQYLGVFILVTMLLNPLFWQHPLQAVQASWHTRQDLLQLQLADLDRVAPEKHLSNPAKSILSLIANAYINPPSFQEVGNYLNYTRSAEDAYLAFSGHTLARGILSGGIFLTMTLAGIILAIKQSIKGPKEHRRRLILLLGATISQTGALLFFVPFPWQRYIMPIIPFLCLWIAYSTSPFFKNSPSDKHQTDS